jgi:tetratricopeptide (TPR) repeat protein
MSTSPQELLQRGIAAARAGENDMARQLIARAIQMDPANEQAWLWLGSVAQSDEERIRILQQVLAINPENEYAIKGLQALGALPEAEPVEPEPAPTEWEEEGIEELADAPVAEAPAPPVESPVRSAPPPPAPDGIPLVESDILDYVVGIAEGVVREGTEQSYDVTLDVTWVPARRRTRRRRVVMRPLVAAALFGGVLGVAGIAFGIYTVLTRPQRIADTGPVGTETITLTPTGTATETPQPSPTATLAPGQPTFTPEATIGFEVPRGDLDFGITETPPYFATVHPDNPRLDDAIEKFHLGDYEAVIEEIPIARETGPDMPDSYFFEGMSYAFLDQYDRAAVVINDGLDQDSNIAALHAALGYVFLRQGALEESRAENATAKRLDPALIMPYLTLAEDYRLAGSYDLALAEVRAALELDAHNVEVLVAQGDIYMAQGRPDSAAAVGNLAVYIDPTAEEAVLLLGRARIGLNQYDQAVMPLEEYLSRVNQASPAVWSLLGEARFLEGSRDKALDAFSKAIILAEDSSEVLVYRGNLFLETGIYEDAFSDFDEAVSQVDSVEARLGRAQAAFATGRYEVALEDIDEVLIETPLDQNARLLRGKTLVELERYDEGLTELNQVLVQGVDDPTERGNAFEYRGRANYYLGLYGNAIIDVEQAFDLGETGTRHYYRGLALEATGNVEGAMLEYEWVLFWDRLYDYSFTEEATRRLGNLNKGGDPQGAPTGEQPGVEEAPAQPAGTDVATPTPVATPSS